MVRPDRKVTIGGLIGSVVTITLWLVDKFLGFYVPPGVEGALVVLLTFVVSYVVRNESMEKDQIRPAGCYRRRPFVGQIHAGSRKGSKE